MQRFSRPYHNKSKKTFGKERQIFIFTLYYQSSIHHHATVYYFVLCNKFFVHYTGKLMLRKKKIVTKITKKKVAFGGIHNSMDYSEKKEKKNIAYTLLEYLFHLSCKFV